MYVRLYTTTVGNVEIRYNGIWNFQRSPDIHSSLHCTPFEKFYSSLRVALQRTTTVHYNNHVAPTVCFVHRNARQLVHPLKEQKMMLPFLYSFFLLFVVTPIATSFVLPQAITPPKRFCPSVCYQSQGTGEYSCVEQKPKTEYAALSPGSAVQIKVGNVTLARKAWKKRRRSGSPLLVPCSVLSMDRKSMVRWNILYLLQKFGQPLDEVEEGAVGFLSDDICLSMGDINKYYSRHLGTSLTVSNKHSICGNSSFR